MSLDNGYMSGKNLEALDGTGIDAYVATGKGEKKDQRPIEDSNRKLKKSDVSYKMFLSLYSLHRLRWKQGGGGADGRSP